MKGGKKLLLHLGNQREFRARFNTLSSRELRDKVSKLIGETLPSSCKNGNNKPSHRNGNEKFKARLNVPFVRRCKVLFAAQHMKDKVDLDDDEEEEGGTRRK
jgi:hypothetical protein